MTPNPDDAGIHPDLHAAWHSLPEPERLAWLLVHLAQAGHGYDLGSPANRRVAIHWWSDFLPARVQIAARTCSTLAEFSSALAGRLRGQVGGRGEEGERHRAVWREVVAVPEDAQRLVLDALERQAAALCTLVRADLDLKRRGRNPTLGTTQEDRRPSPGAGLFAPGDVPAVPPGG